MVSYKDDILQQIMDKTANLVDQNSVDSLRIEVMKGGKRTVIVSDSTMLTAYELGHLLPGSIPKLRAV
jgi:hypothetical protein